MLAIDHEENFALAQAAGEVGEAHDVDRVVAEAHLSLAQLAQRVVDPALALLKQVRLVQHRAARVDHVGDRWCAEAEAGRVAARCTLVVDGLQRGSELLPTARARALQLEHLLRLRRRLADEVRAEALAAHGAVFAARCLENGDELCVEPRLMLARLVDQLEREEPLAFRGGECFAAAAAVRSTRLDLDLRTGEDDDARRQAPAGEQCALGEGTVSVDAPLAAERREPAAVARK
mmetsp:Transcript_46162/g.153022  ORF Transcript_46162/g.153022 Transcript_46162/m.153022 type:complete len:234 (-) Transcript_46162:159-860(-)